MTVAQEQEKTEKQEKTEEPTATEDAEAPQARFILYMSQPQFSEELSRLVSWVQGLLLPVYGRETTTTSPWCPQWWEHVEAIAQLHGLWLAWQEYTGPAAAMIGPAQWHRDFLGPVMTALRGPDGPFAGCKRGSHRLKEIPFTESFGVPLEEQS